MPIHDWTRVRANRFHDFHQDWIGRIRDALNAGRLPPGYFAMREQKTAGPEPDVIALALPGPIPPDPAGGLAVAEHRPKVRLIAHTDTDRYARKADRLVVRHPDGGVVAVIELVSPGNKDSTHAITSFIDKAAAFLDAGIHVLIVDLFPPSKRDPEGVHKLIWDRFTDDDYALPPDKPLTLVSYSSGATLTAYVENVGVGDGLPDIPIFLTEDHYVPCPLEATYQSAWDAFPAPLKTALENP